MDDVVALAADLARTGGPPDVAPLPGAVVDPGLRVVLLPVTTTEGIVAGALGEPLRDADHPPGHDRLTYRSGPPATVCAYATAGVVQALAVRWPPLPGPQRPLSLDARTGTLDLLRRGVSPASTRLAADVLDGTWKRGGASHTNLTVRHDEPGGGHWWVTPYFDGERLTMATLVHTEEGAAGGWDSWSREAEEAARRRHDAWLDAQLGRERTLPWGTAWSGYDERGGFSAVALTYAEVGS